MRITKKIMAIVLALLMVLGLPFAAGASDTPLTLVSAHINTDSLVVLTFSEPIAYTGTLDIRLYTVDENLNSTINNDFPAWSYWWVKIDGYYGDSTTQLVGTLKVPDSENTQRYADVLNFANVNHPGKPLKFAVWEAATGTTASNGFVDNITSADGSKKLVAGKTAARDIAMVDPTEGSVSVDNGNALTLVGAYVNPKTHNEVVLTFSEPIAYTGTLDIRLYTVDANLDSTIDNTFPAWSYWWVSVQGYYGTSTNQLIGKLKVPNSQNDQSYKAVTDSLGANAANLRFALWEDASGTTASNGYVDNITSVDGSKKLLAAKTAARDVAMVKPTQETVTVTSLKVLDDKTGQITFSEGITEGIYRSDATTWKSIRLTNDAFELQKYDPNNANAWLQWGITMHATDDPAVWNFTINGGYRNVTSFSQLAELVRPGGDFAGLKITFAIEQLCQNGDLTNQLDNITSLNGVRPVMATNDNTTAWLDGLYVEIAMPPEPVTFLIVDQTHARILLSGAAKVGTAMPTVDGVAATALAPADTQEYDTAFIATFPDSTLLGNTEMTVPADTFIGLTGTGNEATTVLRADSTFEAVDTPITLDTTTHYSFMNADTGREIAIGDVTGFMVFHNDEDKNIFSFYHDGAYLDLTAATPAWSEQPIDYQLIACENGRYQIFIANGYAVSDTDAGTTNVPTLGLTDGDSIATGWYLTKAGQPKPLRILPIGDSITYGTNPDTAAPRMGWRDDLSKGLTDKLDRYVFVGNQVTKVTDVNDAELARHEGNPGWTVKDHGDRNGIYDLVPATVNKYDPDIVLMMIGINDMAVYASGGFSDAEKNEMKANYLDLVVALSANMEEDDTIFCSRLTPMSADHSMYHYNMPETFNDTWGFNSWVAEWEAEGLPVALNDNYAALSGKSGVICSDGIHLSMIGDPFVAEQYAASILRYYKADGTLVGPDAPAAPTYAYRTSFSVALNAVDGYEYKMDDGEWQSSPVFDDLDPNTEYTFYQRVKAAGRYPASDASAALTVTTDKMVGDNAEAPTMAEKTHNTVTLTAIDGYEYKMNDGEWQSSPLFTDLTPGTTYTFYQRVKETNDSYAGPTSEGTPITTDKRAGVGPTPPPEVEATTHNSVTLKADDNCEFKMNDGEWQSSPVFTGLEPETTYVFYQRVAESDEYYAGAVGEGTEVTTLAAPTVQSGWMLNEVGWWYLNADGSYPAAQWMYIDNVWYYFNEAGYMVTGWQYIGGTWYYFNGGGAMMTGWVNDGGTWYYMNASGAMMTGWVNDGGTWYYMNASGAMVTGWVLDGGTWYYMNASGAMVTGTVVIDGVTQNFTASGAWIA